MKKEFYKYIFNIIILLLSVNSNIRSQNYLLKIFQKLVDKEWIGHYVESEDSHLVHLIEYK